MGCGAVATATKRTCPSSLAAAALRASAAAAMALRPAISVAWRPTVSRSCAASLITSWRSLMKWGCGGALTLVRGDVCE
jgi:hypothetical protein